MRWTVIRVPAVQALEVQQVLVTAFAPITMRIDMQPPASGPEWEIAIQGEDEDAVRAALERTGMVVLASKTEIAPPMEHPWERHGDYDG